VSYETTSLPWYTERKEVKLKKAIVIDGQKVTKLKLREPCAADMVKLGDDLTANGRMLCLIESTADFAPNNLLVLSAKDFVACSDVVNNFLD